MSDRRRPNLAEKLASVLLEREALRGEPIELSVAKQMTAHQICSLFEFDHATHFANGGWTHPTNITARFIQAHREKTRKIDIPAIAKGKRIRAAQEAFRKRLLERTGLVSVDVRGEMADGPRSRQMPKRRRPKRHFPGGKADRARRERRAADDGARR
jgi:hypothetical protein